MLKYEPETYSHFLSQFISNWRIANIFGVKNSIVLKVAIKVLRRSQEFSVVSRTNNVVVMFSMTINTVVSTHSH